MLKQHNKRTIVLISIVIAFSILPIFYIVTKIFAGDVAFWYDPARDLLAGLQNLQKPTLIGPTAGIPGVFYGPYWIWMISVSQLISQDPRIVIFMVAALPYLIVFPLLLILFKRVFHSMTIAVLWLSFLFSYSNYFTDLWNPHLAPLLTLLTIYLLFIQEESTSVKNRIIILCSGFSAGLVMNFHLSFGIGMMLGIIVYLLGKTAVNIFNEKKNKLRILLSQVINLLFFGAGVIFAFIPYILFEARHQFQQTNAFLNALISYGGLVTLQGLDKAAILSNFFERGANLFAMPLYIFVTLLLAGMVYYILKMRKNLRVKKDEMKLLLITLSIGLGILFIYLTAKNPIWQYHFIAVEIIFLIMVGVLINNAKWARYGCFLLVCTLLTTTIFSIFGSFGKDVKENTGSLAAKEVVVKAIHKDAAGSPYTVFGQNNAIYTYDYSYLFKLHAQKDVPYDPGSISSDADVIYLIIPNDAKNSKDFIEYRTPEKEFTTAKEVKFPDDTLVIKKIRKI